MLSTVFRRSLKKVCSCFSFLPSHWHSECGLYDVSFCQKGERGNEGEKERIRNVDIRELRRKVWEFLVTITVLCTETQPHGPRFFVFF